MQAGLHAVGAGLGGLVKRAPSLDRQRVRPLHPEIGAGEMKLGQRVAEPRAMRRGRPADPHAVQEGDDRGRTPGEPPERLALAVLHRLRAGQSARREMLHQTEKERQIIRGDALLVERENEIAATGVQEKIRVLDALRDAFIGQEIAEVVGAQECRNFLGRDIGIDGHGSTGRLRVFRWVAFLDARRQPLRIFLTRTGFRFA